jgi:hypothetical protein
MLAPTSPTSGGRSVGIVLSRAQAAEFSSLRLWCSRRFSSELWFTFPEGTAAGPHDGPRPPPRAEVKNEWSYRHCGVIIQHFFFNSFISNQNYSDSIS